MRIHYAAAFSAALCVSAVFSSGASADIVFDQSIDLTQDGGFSDFDSAFQGADDFQLQSGINTITDVHWWGLSGTPCTTPKPIWRPPSAGLSKASAGSQNSWQPSNDWPTA